MIKILLSVLLTTIVAFAQLSGTYYIGGTGTKPGGGDPEYTTLKAAVDALTSGGVSGPVTMYFTESKTYTEPENVALMPAGTSSTNTITFKPYTGVTATVSFTKTTDNTGLSGGWIIGAKDVTTTSATNYGITVNDSTSYITIDGSNTEGGTTRDLTIYTGSTTHTGTNPIRIFGNVNNITIKNLVITSYQSVSYGVHITPRLFSAVNYIPDNITVENCAITNITGNASQGIGIVQSGTVTIFPYGHVLRNNVIRGRTRGIFMQGAGYTEIYGNNISVLQSNSGSLSHGIYTLIAGSTTTINIYKNTFDTLLTAQATTSGSFGICGITCEGNATYNIYNNMFKTFISSPLSAAADPNLNRISGVHIAAGTVNVYYNTINIGDLGYDPTGNTRPQTIAGIRMSGGTVTAKNNIVIVSEDDDTSYVVYRSGGTLTSNYNNLYQANAAGYIGFYTSARATLSDWQTGSSQDANSKSKAVTFTSATDLHLTGASNGDVDLIGTPIGGYTTDYDDATRHATYPYMGADEASIALPVELTGFTAISRGRSIELRWNTATETNNFGFEVERALPLGGGMGGGQQWTKVGFVPGAGTSNVPKEYSYSDAVSGSGRVSYRLKQIDIDGHFTYHNAVEVQMNAAVANYDLAQNFPNPFNPNTTIRFSVKQMEQASVKVYDVAGREVAVLFNEVANAGQVYNVQFNASGLASGIYFYVLQTQSYREVKKMSLLK